MKFGKIYKDKKEKKSSALEEVRKSKALDRAIAKATELKGRGILDMKSIRLLAEEVTQDIIDKGDAKIDAFKNMTWKERLALKMFKKKIKKAEKLEKKEAPKIVEDSNSNT